MSPLARLIPRQSLALGSALVTAAVAASLATGANPDSSGGADLGRAGATSVGAAWAHDLSGRLVPVTATHYDTPVHAELITHPDQDDMGTYRSSSSQSSAPWPGPATPSNLVTPALPAPSPTTVPILPLSSVRGIDVSGYQRSIDWASVAPHVQFVYAKATEGKYYVNPQFTSEYNGPYDHGVIRGSYHFAIPSNSSGTVQADYFIAHGGGWSADGRTLPGALDIEYNPYGPECYGLSASQMVDWIRDFTTEYAAREHAFPVIYSSTDWWKTCTGDSTAFAAYDPFWVANYGRTGGRLPSGWPYYSFWQYSDSGNLPGDQDVFNGAFGQLQTLAAVG